MVEINPCPGIDYNSCPSISTIESLGGWTFEEYTDYAMFDDYYPMTIISFTAIHPSFGRVFLNDDDNLVGESIEAITDFMSHYIFTYFCT